MRILIAGDYPDDPRLGSAKVPYKLQEEFRALGHDCDLMFSRDLGSRPAARQVRQAVSPALAFRAIRRRLARDGPYDILDVASAEALWLGAWRRSGRAPALRVVCRSNGLEHLYYRALLDDHAAGLRPKPWARRVWYPASRLTQVAAAARLADRLLLVNDGDRRFALMRRWKREEEIAVVAHGVSTRYLESPPDPDAPRGGGLLFCGTWDALKGIDYLVRAFTRVVDLGAGANLTILGGGAPESAIAAAFPERVRPSLTILPRLDEEGVIQQYRAHDALVWCSTYEGFGLVVVEAMSQGLPVVATPVGCVPSLIVHGCNGVVVPPRDEAALATALLDLLADPERRRAIASAALETARALTWTRTAERTLGVYRGAWEGAR
jgi:glycosyltransferase involved in cell wall biosynthesis